MYTRRKQIRRSYKDNRKDVKKELQMFFSATPNPLTIPHIINEIISYLPFEELKISRLISNQWNTEACKFLELKSEVILQTYDELKAYYSLFRESQEQLFHHYHLGSKLSLAMPFVQKFFTDFGSSIKTLRLEKVGFTDQQLQDILFNKLPNLEDFTFEFEEVEFWKTEKRTLFINNKIRTLPKLTRLCLRVEDAFDVILLRDFILASPNLLEVTSKLKESKKKGQQDSSSLKSSYGGIIDLADFSTGNFEDFPVFGALVAGFEFFDIIIAGVLFYDIPPLDQPSITFTTTKNCPSLALRKLEKFDLKIKYNSNCLQRLQAKAFPLKYLDMARITPDVKIETLNNFLQSLSNTLVHLRLKFDPRSSCCNEFSSSTYLTGLKTCHFDGYKGALDFVKHLGKLNTLSFTNINLNRALTKSKFEENFIHSSLKIFNVYHDVGNKLTVESINIITRIFPHLKEVRLENMTDTAIQIIFTNLPLLFKLSITESYVTDYGITGIESEKLSNRKISETTLKRLRATTPWIGNLKCLHTLELGCRSLTDKCIAFGISKCREIRRLIISSYGITDKSLYKIANEMDSFYLETRLCNQLTLQSSNFAKAQLKLKGREGIINEFKAPTNLLHFMEKYGASKVCISKPTQDKCIQTDSEEHNNNN